MRQHWFIAVTLALTSNLASAGPDPGPSATSLVEAQLIQPLAAKDRKQSRFSRARLPPAERRVRMANDKPQRDSTGEAFVTFAIDSRGGWDDSSDAPWQTATITGCVYPGRGDVFIKRGNAYHPAAAALGKKTKPSSSTTCRSSSDQAARQFAQPPA